MARRVANLSLATNQQLEMSRGQGIIKKGKSVAGLALLVTIVVANSTAGNVQLATADRTALLNMLRARLKYGPSDNERTVIDNIQLTVLRLLHRFCFGVEVLGYDDTTDGLRATIPASSSLSVKFRIIIPTGRLWFLGRWENLFAMGRSQFRTATVSVERGAAPSLTAGLSVSGNVSVDIFPVEVATKGDRGTWIPELRLPTSTDYKHQMDDGLPLLVAERTTAHSATTITRVNLSIDDEEIHRDASPDDLEAEYADAVPNYPTAADLSDALVLLYQAGPDRALAELPTGRLSLEQPNKDLATMSLLTYALPVVGEAAEHRMLVEVANIRGKAVQATSVNDLEQHALPDRLTAFLPVRYLDNQDREINLYAGLSAPARGQVSDVRVRIPEGIEKAAKARALLVGGDDAQKHVARHVRSAASGGRGFGIGSNAFVAISQAL